MEDTTGNADSNVFGIITIGGKEFILRFPGLIQISIEKEAGKRLFDQPNQRFTAKSLLRFLDHTEVQAYLLWKGIMGGMPEYRGKNGMKFEEAVELRDQFLMEGELDAGEKLEALTDAIGNAVTAADGASGKKLKERIKKEQAETRAEELKNIYKAKMQAEQELQAEKEQDGTGASPGSDVTES
jgi:hypothetical protein